MEREIAGRMRPTIAKGAAKAEFERWAHTYDRSILQHVVFQPSYRAFLEEFVRWRLDDPTPFDVLDVGCGTGTWLAMLAATPLPTRRLLGLDYAAAMCSLAKAKADQVPGCTIAFMQGDAEHLPLGDGSVDAITCSNSFHHYPHQAAVVREFRRALRPGGRLLIIDGFRDNLIGWVAFDVVVATAEKHVHHAPWSAMRRYFVEAGFRDVHQRKFGVWVPLCVTVGTA